MCIRRSKMIASTVQHVQRTIASKMKQEIQCSLKINCHAQNQQPTTSRAKGQTTSVGLVCQEEVQELQAQYATYICPCENKLWGRVFLRAPCSILM